MQERRTSIRINRLSRAQYCPADDLVPRDGRLTNLSERGAGLLLREAHRIGERITVSFTLPDAEEPVTATGVVRWSDDRSRQGRWYPLGLEWLGLEEATRHRLQGFISQQAQSVPAAPARTAASARRILISAALLGIVVGISFLAYQLVLTQRQNRQLDDAITQRDMTIDVLEGRANYLKQREIQLQQDLTSTRIQLEMASDSVAQLGAQTEEMAGNILRLHEEVERFQQSYVQVREEREELMQRVLDLQQERMLLQKKLASIPDLHRAIREAVRGRQRQRRLAGQQAFDAARAAQANFELEGNQGYLVRDGQSTFGRAAMSIHVLEPEAAPSSSSAATTTEAPSSAP